MSRDPDYNTRIQSLNNNFAVMAYADSLDDVENTARRRAAREAAAAVLLDPRLATVFSQPIVDAPQHNKVTYAYDAAAEPLDVVYIAAPTMAAHEFDPVATGAATADTLVRAYKSLVAQNEGAVAATVTELRKEHAERIATVITELRKTYYQPSGDGGFIVIVDHPTPLANVAVFPAVDVLPRSFPPTSSASDTKRYISAQELQSLSEALAMQIARDGFKPTFIIALWRGGCHIGAVVQEFLEYVHGVKIDHVAARTVSRDSEGKPLPNVRIHATGYARSVLKRTDRLLYIDDVWDRGTSLAALDVDLRVHLGPDMPSDVRRAVLFYKPERNVMLPDAPEYYVETSAEWLVLPHEIVELSDAEAQKHRPFAWAMKQQLSAAREMPNAVEYSTLTPTESDDDQADDDEFYTCDA